MSKFDHDENVNHKNICVYCESFDGQRVVVNFRHFHIIEHRRFSRNTLPISYPEYSFY